MGLDDLFDFGDWDFVGAGRDPTIGPAAPRADPFPRASPTEQKLGMEAFGRAGG
jgi:hypothetical protein